jgi:hypothetical protein
VGVGFGRRPFHINTLRNTIKDEAVLILWGWLRPSQHRNHSFLLSRAPVPSSSGAFCLSGSPYRLGLVIDGFKERLCLLELGRKSQPRICEARELISCLW